MTDFPGGRLDIRRRADGAVRVSGPADYVVSPANAVAIAKALLKEAGVDVVLADPGQTVIRAPRRVS